MIKPQERFSKFLKNSKFSILFYAYFIIILAFGALFFLLSSTEDHGIYRDNLKISSDARGFFDALYFSFVTSTSLGYGDIKPLGLSRIFSIVEVIISLMIFGVLLSKLLSANQERILEELYDVSFQERYTRIVSGLYNFRAEIEIMIGKVKTLKKEEIEEFLQDVESNLHLMSSYLADSGKILAEFRKTPKEELDFKEEIILDNIHSSIAKLEELFSQIKDKRINCKRKAIINNLNMILILTENICKRCANLEYGSIREITKEVEKHSGKLKTAL